MASSQKLELYDRLHSYDFTSDAKFTAGWSQLRSGLVGATEDVLAQKYLEAKIFFYSKFRETVSIGEYMTWLSEQGRTSSGGAIKEPEENQPVSEQEESDRLASGPQNDENHSLGSGDPSNVSEDTAVHRVSNMEEGDLTGDRTTALDSNEAAQYPTSFYELLAKVEKGEPIPGVEELNIEPTNAPVTEATHVKVKKPWELTVEHT